MQDLDRAISEAEHSQRTLTQTHREAQAELTDFIRTRTEIECIIKDLEAAGASASRKREQLEVDLAQVQQKVAEKEAALVALLPEWEEQRTTEATEKRRLDEANAKLNALFAKQGRASKTDNGVGGCEALVGDVASVAGGDRGANTGSA